MIIKKFVAPTMTEALARVKNEMGDQAVILKTRMNRKTNGHGEQPDKGVEVTAAVETDKKKRFEIPASEPQPSVTPIPGPKQEIASLKSSEPRQETPSELLKQLAQEISMLKETILNRQNYRRPVTFFGNLSGAILEAGRQLMEAGLSEDLALDLITRVSQSEDAVNLTPSQIRSQIRGMLENMIPAGEPIALRDAGPTVTMFIGPTGVGKTSAVARVGMLHKMGKTGQLAIISTDNFRADSSQQIKSFCRILGCPCAVVYSPEELAMAIKSQTQGLILIDTPGVNPRDSHELGELQSLVRAAKPHEIHLVTAAGVSAFDLSEMLNAFSDFAIDKILITKMDETSTPGGIVATLIKSGKKPSYISRSREIPGQFGPVVPRALADSILAHSPSENNQQIWQTEVVGIWQ
jgi:flagellar biosynthesis protein FlhF